MPLASQRPEVIVKSSGIIANLERSDSQASSLNEPGVRFAPVALKGKEGSSVCKLTRTTELKYLRSEVKSINEQPKQDEQNKSGHQWMEWSAPHGKACAM